MSIFIENGMVYTEGKLSKLNIIIDDGKIIELTKDKVTCSRYIDAQGKIILPGMIDSSVIMGDMSDDFKENFSTGSAAAAAGGITTILVIPSFSPATVTESLLAEKRKLAVASVVDYGFHFGAASNNLSEIKKVREVASISVFAGNNGKGAKSAALNISDSNSLKDLFSSSKIFSLHARGEKIADVIKFVRQTKNKLYISNIVSKEEIEYIKKSYMGQVFAEVSISILFPFPGNGKKSSNDKKEKEEYDFIWDSLSNGLISTISSNHVPISKKPTNISSNGSAPGLETTLPLLIDAFNKDKISLHKIVELCCENPAKIFMIENKGAIKKGYAADLIIIDPKLEKTVSNEKLFTGCKWSPYAGMKLKGWPVLTIIGGNIVFEDGDVNIEKPGKEISFIKPFFAKLSPKKEQGSCSDAEIDESESEENPENTGTEESLDEVENNDIPNEEPKIQEGEEIDLDVDQIDTDEEQKQHNLAGVVQQ